MTALLAQAASAGEWYDGWQLAVIIVTVVVSPMLALIGWLHRQMSRGFADSKSDLAAAEERLEGNIAKVRSDLVAAEERLEGKIAEVKTDLTADIAEVRTDLTGKIAEVKTDLSGKIAEVKTDLSGKIAEVKTDLTADIAEVKTDLSGKIAEVRTDIASVDGDLKDLKNKLYEDALGKVAMYQWQLAAPQPSASEAPSSQPLSQQPAPQPKQLAETSND